MASPVPPDAPLPVGMVGCGRHAQLVLLPALTYVPHLKLVALATSRSETAQAAEQKWRLRCHVGYESLIADPQVQAVLIVGGPHEPQIEAALAAGKDVWCETPGVTSAERGRRLLELAAASARVVQIGSCLRYAPVYGAFRARLERWRIEHPGPRMFEVRYYPYIAHFYNLLMYLAGDITSVLALPSAHGAHVLLQLAQGDTAGINYRDFHNNSLPQEYVSASAPSGLLEALDGRELRFWRTEEQAHPMDLHLSTSAADLQAPTFSLPYCRLNQLYLRGYVPELADFARCVAERARPLAGLEGALKTLLVTQAVQRALQSGSWESVEVA